MHIMIVVLAGIIGLTLWLTNRTANETSIQTFVECEAAGYSIMESYPRQCMTPGGETFVEPLDDVVVPQDLSASEFPE